MNEELQVLEAKLKTSELTTEEVLRLDVLRKQVAAEATQTTSASDNFKAPAEKTITGRVLEVRVVEIESTGKSYGSIILEHVDGKTSELGCSVNFIDWNRNALKEGNVVKAVCEVRKAGVTQYKDSEGNVGTHTQDVEYAVRVNKSSTFTFELAQKRAIAELDNEVKDSIHEANLSRIAAAAENPNLMSAVERYLSNTFGK